MLITDIRIKKSISKKSSIKGFATITMDDSFIIHDVKIIKGKDKEYFLGMPSKKSNKKFLDIVHPSNSEVRKYITSEVLEAFRKLDPKGE